MYLSFKILICVLLSNKKMVKNELYKMMILFFENYYGFKHELNKLFSGDLYKYNFVS